MAQQNQFQSCLDRMQEALLYSEQGLKDEAIEILEDILKEINTCDLSDAERNDLDSRIREELGQLKEGRTEASVSSPEVEKTETERFDPEQTYGYGLALMDSQFWDEATREFKKSAAAGHRVMECWELCGDCAAHLEKWDEAIRYYEIVYTNPLLTDKEKQPLLVKITKCSKAPLQRREGITKSSQAATDSRDRPAGKPRREDYASPTFSAATSQETHRAIDKLMGQQIHSWKNAKGKYLVEEPRSYRVLNLLHIGMTSMIVELEAEGSSERFAGQTLLSPWDRCLPPERLAAWAYRQLMMDSPFLVSTYDLAHHEDQLFVVREYMPKSLSELLLEQETLLPVPVATSFAHQILEGVGYLHLHMGRDQEKSKIFHLDLRPSRVLVHPDKRKVKICNGGLWMELQKGCAKETGVQHLPLAVLPYRAPEQFRTYLARRRPPFFTDIYQAGVLFYEMLTGHPPCQASSFEEYEIQHCDQYPVPPKVWRSEIPEELSHMIMKCLEMDPMKRWRSPTQLSLALEKFL